MTTLVPGGNAPVATGQLRVDISYTPIPGADLDISAFALTNTGKVRGDGDMCFYGQTSILSGAVQLTASSAGRAEFTVDLSRVDPAVEKVALTATIYENKATFDKSRSSISLEKTSAGFGEIKVNLNWNQGGTGLLGGLLGKRNAIDLDLGCLFEMQDGYKGAVQALGKRFGDLRGEPYIQLMGDDRTGSVAGGEWLHINGQHWSEVKRILVFAFIYDGAPNWKATDGVVTIFVPGQPEIEVRMNEEGGRHGMCAIALLENVNGAVKVSRRVDFHPGHEEMDRAYGWGMRWKAGSK
uniref:Tellurium resistance protein TerA n=1 Tax=Pseudomonas putida TaxID=303 RepID=A0A2Z1CC34_PSEPU|nr:TerD family protein [Pseudomonas putida]ALZ46067.1 Tellurium resistance protein TerA [Pseudomonas putida]